MPMQLRRRPQRPPSPPTGVVESPGRSSRPRPSSSPLNTDPARRRPLLLIVVNFLLYQRRLRRRRSRRQMLLARAGCHTPSPRNDRYLGRIRQGDDGDRRQQQQRRSKNDNDDGKDNGDKTPLSYETVCGGKTGHAETVRVTLDREVLNPHTLFDCFL